MRSPTIFPTRMLAAQEPAQLPLHILLAIPDYMTDTIEKQPSSDEILNLIRRGINPETFYGAPLHASPFNLTAAISLLFKHLSWEQSRRIIQVDVWSPGWNNDQLRDFIKAPFQGHTWPYPNFNSADLRVAAFPGGPGAYDPEEPLFPRYEIIHFLGRVDEYQFGVGLNPGKRNMLIRPGALRDSLVRAKTRLLILHVPTDDIEPASELGRNLSGSGGPAVLTVAGGYTASLDEYYFNLYAAIIHNTPLQEICWPSPGLWDSTGIQAHLFMSKDASDSLQFNRWMQSTLHSLDKTSKELSQQRAHLQQLIDECRRYLHTQQFNAAIGTVHKMFTSMERKRREMDAQSQRLNELLNKPWNNEFEGIIPLAELAERSEPTISESVYINQNSTEAVTKTRQALEVQKKQAPRLLNANFALPGNGQMLDPYEALLEEKEYDLLVDIGPLWDKAKSIVEGRSDFPIQSLPPGSKGYLIDVILFSDDFSPATARAQLWLPTGGGRSSPAPKGVPAQASGPVRLRLRAPRISEGLISQFAYARLSLYYSRSMLQSADVEVTVARDFGGRLSSPNRITIDYVATGGFQNLDQFSQRQVLIDLKQEEESLPVRLNVTMNQNSVGDHRLIFHYGPARPSSLSPGKVEWTTYDPQAVSNLLQQSRQRLLDCYYVQGQDGRVLDKHGNPTLKKETKAPLYDLIYWDLVNLAQFGHSLLYGYLLQTHQENGREWISELRRALAERSVIQIVRAGSFQYAFPWALIYEYPLEINMKRYWRPCRSVEEIWGSFEGPGTVAPLSACPYENYSWHKENIICPYGFWGLKHIIEEPPSLATGSDLDPLGSSATLSLLKPQIELAVGVTRDATLDLTAIDRHLDCLNSLPSFHLNPLQPAEDWMHVKDILRSPQVVYFLCHGEHDNSLNEPYLSIGPRDKSIERRIYPVSSLEAWWNSSNPPDKSSWKQHHPLIILNGCHTNDLTPGQVVNFASTFTRWGAGGVLGTETNVMLDDAITVAEAFFEKLSSPTPPPLGQALHQIRWELARKGNLIGLAYTLYALADYKVTRINP